MTFGSLFTGARGFDIGFEAAGMKSLWEVEITRGTDIRDVNGNDLESVDLICGGPPCQTTSYAAAFHGQRSGVSLWSEMLRIITARTSKWVVVEQPPGGRDIIVQATIDLQRLGYGCAGRVIDSRHWVPQTRSRWFVVARMGTTGMALWDLLYSDRQRVERGQQSEETHAEGWHKNQAESSRSFAGECAHCLPSGVYSRISSRKSALIGAGNAVSPPVARWLAERIQEAEHAVSNA